ncbi:6850_t:CDS:2, partial [Entrophospora sp. SA101]
STNSTNSTNSTEKSIEDELATLDSAHTDQFLEEYFPAEAPLTTNSTNSIPELENDDDTDKVYESSEDEDEFWSAILSETNIPELISEPEIIEPVTEPEIIDSTPEPIPEPIVYMDKKLEELYQGVKTNWEECGNDSEDFDWGCFIKEIIDHKNHPQYDYQKDLFHYKLHMHIQVTETY